LLSEIGTTITANKTAVKAPRSCETVRKKIRPFPEVSRLRVVNAVVVNAEADSNTALVKLFSSERNKYRNAENKMEHTKPDVTAKKVSGRFNFLLEM